MEMCYSREKTGLEKNEELKKGRRHKWRVRERGRQPVKGEHYKKGEGVV